MRLAAKGDISSAIGILRPLVEASDDPEDRLLLGRMAYLATDYTEAQAQLGHAYREFQVRGLPRRAAIAATALGRLYFDGLEDQVVGRGWFARALTPHPHCRKGSLSAQQSKKKRRLAALDVRAGLASLVVLRSGAGSPRCRQSSCRWCARAG